MEVKCKNYIVNATEEGFSVTKGDILWVKLPIAIEVNANGLTDRDEFKKHFSFETEKEKSIFKWTTSSNLWSRKEYVLEVAKDYFLFYVNVKGNGKVDSVVYFNNPKFIKYEIGEYILPLVNDRNKKGNTRMIVESSVLDIGRAVPPSYVFPFTVEDEKGSLGLGIVAKSGNYNFDILKYDHPFKFTLPQYGQTKISGEWQSQAVLGLFAETEEEVLKEYSNWHFANGYAKPHDNNIPKWWCTPTFCGWGEQYGYYLKDPSLSMQRYACRQEFYDEMIDKLEKEDLHPGTVIIDSKWQKSFGVWEPEEERWPDLRAFVEEQHKKGIRVMLWLKAWDPEGLPEDECIHLLCNPVAADPTNPKYRERVKNYIHKLLSDEEGCYNCDGFKVDFLNCIPKGEDVRTYTGVYGVELIKAWLQLVYDESKSVKPEALVSAFTAHPYFSSIVDRTRNHDYTDNLRAVRSIMSYRSMIYRAANPGVPMDMDSGGIGSVREFHRCMEFQAEYGVPSLYWVSPLGEKAYHANVPFDKNDFDCIRKAWKSYNEKLDKKYK